MAFIDMNREELGVEPICRELAVAPASHHDHAARDLTPGFRPVATRDRLLLSPSLATVATGREAASRSPAAYVAGVA